MTQVDKISCSLPFLRPLIRFIIFLYGEGSKATACCIRRKNSLPREHDIARVIFHRPKYNMLYEPESSGYPYLEKGFPLALSFPKTLGSQAVSARPGAPIPPGIKSFRGMGVWGKETFSGRFFQNGSGSLPPGSTPIGKYFWHSL